MNKNILKDISFKYIFLFIVCIILPNSIPLGLQILGYMSIDRSIMFFAYCMCIICLLYFTSSIIILLFRFLFMCLVYIDYALIIRKSFFMDFVDVLLHTKNMVNFDFRSSVVYYNSLILIVVFILFNLILISYTKRFFEIDKSKKYLLSSIMLCMVAFIPFYMMQPEEEESNIDRVVDPTSNRKISSFKEVKVYLKNGEKIDTAIEKSGLIDFSDKKKNYIVVLVESLGVFKDKKLEDLVLAPLNTPDLHEKYTITSGEIPFYGNTTWGETREVCGVYNNFPDILADKTIRCLPDVMNALGYKTVAFRSFETEFSGFSKFYPRAGFQDYAFGNDLVERAKGRIKLCKALFMGACDPDVMQEIGKIIKETEEPLFIYWVTVNSHQPIPISGLVSPRYNCDTSKDIVDNKEVCFTLETWNEFFTSVADVAKQLDNTEVLLVGDHAPPFLRRQSRDFFSRQNVPWIRFSPKELKN